MRIKGKDWDIWMVYYYLKSGITALAFLLTPLNFIMLAYNFSSIKNYIPIYEFAFILATVGVIPLTFLGRYSWRKGELRKAVDAGIDNNSFVGAQARAWIKMLEGDIEGSRKEMEQYIKCGEMK